VPKPTLSIVIPTLNEAGTIGAAVAALRKSGISVPYEIIVADGASDDGSADEARRHGCAVVTTYRGRGPQLGAGAQAAVGEWLLFVHSDTELGPGWWSQVKAFIDDPANVRRAAAFRFRLDDDAFAARLLERVVNLRARWLAMPYGDQGLLIGHDFYRQLGGYAMIELMEDVDFVRRIGRGRLRHLEADAITSAEYYRRDGYLYRPMKNLLCLSLYFLGVPVPWIRRLYA